MRYEQFYRVVLNINNGMADYVESVYEQIKKMCKQQLNKDGFFNLLHYVNGNSYVNGTLRGNQVSITLKARSGMLE